MSINFALPGGRLIAVNESLTVLIAVAYQLPESRILELPDWRDSERFDIDARADGNPGIDERRMLLQSLLADRFKLTAHWETRQLEVYALAMLRAGKFGPDLHTSEEKCDPSAQPSAQSNPTSPIPTCDSVSVANAPDKVTFTLGNITMRQLATALTGFGPNRNVDRPIVDRTGLTGRFNLTLAFAPLRSSSVLYSIHHPIYRERLRSSRP